jgi:hypothetical protein
MAHAMLCRVIRLQFRLQTFVTSRGPAYPTKADELDKRHCTRF